MNNFRFQNWKVYQDSKIFFKEILIINNNLSTDLKYSIGSQLIRSSLSVTLNITEGAGKSSDKEINRFFNISIGSIYETVAILDILSENNYISKEKYLKLTDTLGKIQNQLGGFKKRLKL
jgi:four helix bundle protein